LLKGVQGNIRNPFSESNDAHSYLCGQNAERLFTSRQVIHIQNVLGRICRISGEHCLS